MNKRTVGNVPGNLDLLSAKQLLQAASVVIRLNESLEALTSDQIVFNEAYMDYDGNEITICVGTHELWSSLRDELDPDLDTCCLRLSSQMQVLLQKFLRLCDSGQAGDDDDNDGADIEVIAPRSYPCNVNEDTGIPYGVIPANDSPSMAEAIFEYGANVSQQRRERILADQFNVRMNFLVKEERGKLELCGTADKPGVERFSCFKMVRVLMAAIVASVNQSLSDDILALKHESVIEDTLSHLVDVSTNITEGDAWEHDDSFMVIDWLAEQGLWEVVDTSEDSHTYWQIFKEGQIKLELSYLGGAALIFVLQSPWVVKCRQCSPCVPHAGDLTATDENGMQAYSLPPEDMPEAARPLVTLLPVNYGND